MANQNGTRGEMKLTAIERPTSTDIKRKAITRVAAAIGSQRQACNKVAQLRVMLWKNGATCDPKALMLGLDEVAEMLIVVDEELQMARDHLQKHLNA